MLQVHSRGSGRDSNARERLSLLSGQGRNSQAKEAPGSAVVAGKDDQLFPSA